MHPQFETAMSLATDQSLQTLADLMERLGHVPLGRIRFRPPPGTATEQDVLRIASREGRLCELVDGVLVDKAMGYEESVLAVYLARMLGNYVAPRNLGHVSGEAGMVRLYPGLVRIPDVAFASWDRFPQRSLSGESIPNLAPDLAIEVLSASNTPAEMRIKTEEYFSAGVRLVWLVDPEVHLVCVRAVVLVDVFVLRVYVLLGRLE
jgi:Uma2 family endonuclease